jgi:hypothetical protein
MVSSTFSPQTNQIKKSFFVTSPKCRPLISNIYSVSNEGGLIAVGGSTHQKIAHTHKNSWLRLNTLSPLIQKGL